jgi:hypothetical protein
VTTRFRVEAALWALAVLLATAAGLGVRADVRGSDGSPPFAVANARASRPRSVDSVAQWSRALAARDPFRLARAPATVRFGSQPPISEVTRVPRPTLVLSGLLGGPPWRAIIEGVPGHQGSFVVASGDSLGALRIRTVTRDSIVIQGLDTTWVLRTPEHR